MREGWLGGQGGEWERTKPCPPPGSGGVVLEAWVTLASVIVAVYCTVLRYTAIARTLTGSQPATSVTDPLG